MEIYTSGVCAGAGVELYINAPPSIDAAAIDRHLGTCTHNELYIRASGKRARAQQQCPRAVYPAVVGSVPFDARQNKTVNAGVNSKWLHVFRH